MKKVQFAMVFLFISCFGYSQIKVNSSEKNYLNKSIWSQIFNDFEGKLTIPVITPWVIGIGTFNYIKTDVFMTNMLKEDDIFSRKDLKFREVTNSINTSFVNFIPKDSIMRMRAIYKDRVLYNYEISQTDTTLNVDFSVPSKNNGETIVFDKTGRLLTFNSFDIYESTSIKNLYLSDSISIRSTSHSESKNDLIEKQRLENGCTVRKTTYKKDKLSLKESFVSDIIYKYDKESRLICMQNLNKKGRATDSVIYDYDDQGKISRILQQRDNVTSKSIVYDYQNTDIVIKKFNPLDYLYTITYNYDAGKLKHITIDESVYFTNAEFDFEYNTQGLLMTASELSFVTTTNNTAPKKQIIFSYNENNNIKKVSVINSSGVITKEINFEYDYL